MSLLSRIFSKSPKPSDSVTVGFQKVLSNARSIADLNYSSYVGTEHILLGILWLQDGLAIEAIKKEGIQIETIKKVVKDRIRKEEKNQRPESIPYTPKVGTIIRKGEKEAISLGHQNLAPEHLLLGILTVSNPVSKLLSEAGLTATDLRETIRELTNQSEQGACHNADKSAS